MSSKAESAIRCVGTGFVALDIIRSALDENTTIEQRHAGGSCGNVLAILSYLGVSTSAVGRIGKDRPGAELLSDLRRWKVDVRLLVLENDRRTPVVIQETFVDARGRPRHRFSRACPVCGAMMAGYRPLLRSEVAVVADALPTHDFFFFDRVAPGTVALARRSRDQGALVVFEPSGIKNENLFVECLQVSHILKYSGEQISIPDALVDRSPIPVEIETLGTEGLRFRMRQAGRAGAWRHLSAFPAFSMRDSAGSGDWCTAGLLAHAVADGGDPMARFNDEKAISDSLHFGQALAALNCSYDGARGLMYAVDRASALRAAEQLLDHVVPRLRQGSSPVRVGRRLDGGCVVCSSDLHAAHV